jgi:hypothetical protein
MTARQGGWHTNPAPQISSPRQPTQGSCSSQASPGGTQPHGALLNKGIALGGLRGRSPQRQWADQQPHKNQDIKGLCVMTCPPAIPQSIN